MNKSNHATLARRLANEPFVPETHGARQEMLELHTKTLVEGHQVCWQAMMKILAIQQAQVADLEEACATHGLTQP